MGRHKKLPIPPESVQSYVRTNTDWKVVLEQLKKMAFGGYEFTNYNGIKTIAEPSVEAMRMLMLYAWGRPGEVSPDDSSDKTIQAMKQFSDFVASVNKPVKTKKKTDVEEISDEEITASLDKPKKNFNDEVKPDDGVYSQDDNDRL